MIVKRSVSIRGHPTSISVEDEFWTQLRAIADADRRPLAVLIAAIDAERALGQNLSSAIRVFVLRQALKRSEGDQPSSPGTSSSGGVTPGSPS